MTGGAALAFWQLIIFEGLLLLAAGMTIAAGIRGIIGSAVILSGLIGWIRAEDFWNWEFPLLIGVSGAAAILVYLSRKAGEGELIASLAGGISSLVVLGTFLTPIIALMAWVMIMGTGLMPRMTKKQIFWGIAPTVWRTVIGLGWIIGGNILV